VERRTAQLGGVSGIAKRGKGMYPNPRSGPAITELKKSLSRRVCAFFVPMRLTSSTVCWGVKASIIGVFFEQFYEGRFLREGLESPVFGTKAQENAMKETESRIEMEDVCRYFFYHIKNHTSYYHPPENFSLSSPSEIKISIRI